MDVNSFWKGAQAARLATGKPYLSQIVELLRLRFGEAKLGLDEYYAYRLYDDTLFTFREKQEFVSWRQLGSIDAALNQDVWRKYANDKVAFSLAMLDAGLRTPKIAMLYSKTHTQECPIRVVRTVAEIESFLSTTDEFPIFAKPVHGTYGRGGFAIRGFDKTENQLVLCDDSRLALSKAIEGFEQEWAGGYLFQELLRPHPLVESVVGNRLSSLRVIVLLVDSKPQVFRAVWKLPTGANMSDNFMHGELGNLIAAVDPASGVIGDAFGRVRDSIEVVKAHPDTGVQLKGLKVPQWDQIREFCAAAAKLFPGLLMQHWDVALTKDGIVALEVNVEGSVDLHQIAGRRGVNDHTLRSLRRDAASHAVA